MNISYDGKGISTAPSSTYSHVGSSLGLFQNTLIVVGHQNENRKVEQFDTKWTTLADFPFVLFDISAYSMVTFKDALYIFGNVILSHEYHKFTMILT